MATFSFKLVGGGGFAAQLGSVRGITPAKKRGHCIVHVLWGKRHKKTPGDCSELVPMKAVGDAKKLRARWRRLLSAEEAC